MGADGATLFRQSLQTMDVLAATTINFWRPFFGLRERVDHTATGTAQKADSNWAFGVPPLVNGIDFENLLADKAFDYNWLTHELNERGAGIVISQRKNDWHR